MPRAEPTQRSDFAHFESMTTRWRDNDQFGHMNNVVHYSLMDTALSNWQMTHGFFADQTGTHMVVVESGCRYHREAAYPDTIHCGLRTTHIGGSSWRLDMGLFRNDEEMAFADGFFVQVLVDSDSGTPTPLTEAFRAALETLQH